MPLAELKGGDLRRRGAGCGSLRNATVTMRTNGVLLRLGKQDFIALLREPLLAGCRAPRPNGMLPMARNGWMCVPAEYQNDRPPGAINIPLNEIRNAIGLLDKDKEYIVYCQSGWRSSAAAFIPRAARLPGPVARRRAARNDPSLMQKANRAPCHPKPQRRPQRRRNECSPGLLQAISRSSPTRSMRRPIPTKSCSSCRRTSASSSMPTG